MPLSVRTNTVVCGYTYFPINDVECTMQETEVKGFRMQTYAQDSGTHMYMLICMHFNMYISCTCHTKVIGNDMYQFAVHILMHVTF